jgi:beta-mannosidase
VALYACNVAQLLQMRGQIALFRSRNIWGIQIWQLNEIWPTGGWGSMVKCWPFLFFLLKVSSQETAALAYLKGQYMGGRWKPFQYGLRDHLYRERFVFCGGGGLCFVKNDQSTKAQFNITLSSIDLKSGEIKLISNHQSSGIPFTASWFCANNISKSKDCDDWNGVVGNVNSTILQIDTQEGDDFGTSYFPLTTIGNLALTKPNIVGEQSSFSQSSPHIFLQSDAVAIFVFLSSTHCVSHTNNFILFPNQKLDVTIECDGVWSLEDLTLHHAQEAQPQ